MKQARSASTLKVTIEKTGRGFMVHVNGEPDLFFHNFEIAQMRKTDIEKNCTCMADVERSRECSNSMTGGQCF